MAKDVAQRELDQAGFRISNLGTPTAAGDATKTDNATAPLANSGAGSPGSSLLAAPADHVHPAAPSTGTFSLTLTDQSEQSQTGSDEALVAQFPIDFIGAPAGLVPVIDALVDVDSGTATFNVRLSAVPDTVDGDLLVAIVKPATGTFELKSSLGPIFAPPATPAIIKITAANDNAEATCRIRSKTVTLRAA
jgi:hypothetical protein